MRDDPTRWTGQQGPAALPTSTASGRLAWALVLQPGFVQRVGLGFIPRRRRAGTVDRRSSCLERPGVLLMTVKHMFS